MRRLLPLLLILSSFALYSQAWAPFKVSDSIQHFLSNNVSPSNGMNLYTKQIQSVVTKTKLQDSVKSTLIFKKGYSKTYNIWANGGAQIIKGQIFGDTAVIYNDSSIFKSADVYGFTLFFPHQYLPNSNFTLATKANGNYLNAQVDTLYTDSIGNSIDSLVELKIFAYDNMNAIDTNGGFHLAKIIISKSYGLLSGFDFTYLKRKIEIEQHITNTHLITKNKNNQLSIGDEYHTYEYRYDLNGTHRISKEYTIIGDTTIGQIRNITYNKIEQYILNTNTTTTTTTFQKSFNTLDSVIFFESQIIEDSLLNPLVAISSLPEFAFCSTCVNSNITYSLNSEYNIYYNFITQQKDTIRYSNSGLNAFETLNVLGVDDYFYYSFINWQNTRKSIVYIKKGNQVWGTPLNLTVGITNLQTENKIAISPNPTTGRINISKIQNIDRIEVYNMQGQLVQSFSPQGRKDFQLNSKAGLYVLKIYLKDGSSSSVKIVKQ